MPTITVAVVRHGISVDMQVADHIEKYTTQFLERGNMLETSSSCPLSKMHQVLSSLLPFDHSQSAISRARVQQAHGLEWFRQTSVYALGKLVEILNLMLTLQPRQNELSFADRQSNSSGDTRSTHSIVATSSSIALPGTTLITSLAIHFMPLAYKAAPHFACSP
jgi:hypothetical protein